MNKSILLFGAFVYTIILVILSLISNPNLPDIGSSFDDKIYHFGAYFVLAFLWLTYFKYYNKEIRLFIVFLLLILFGVSLELFQHSFNSNREYDVYDLTANCIGVVIGTLFSIFCPPNNSTWCGPAA